MKQKTVGGIYAKTTKNSMLCYAISLGWAQEAEIRPYWAQAYGGNGNEAVNSMEKTFDNGWIIAGETNSFGYGSSDFLVIKLNSDGQIEWQKAYGGSDIDIAYSIKQTTDGGYIVAGYTESSPDEAQALVIKLTASGDMEWQTAFGGTSSDWANAVRETTDGGYVVVGQTNSSGNSLFDAWITTLDKDGNIICQMTYQNLSPPDRNDRFYDIEVLDDGNFIIVGSSNSFNDDQSDDVWVIKLSPFTVEDLCNQEVLWQKAYNTGAYEEGYDILQTSDGGFVVAGVVTTSGGDTDYFVLKIDYEGNIEWQKRYGEEGCCWPAFDERANSIKQTPDNGYVVFGYTGSIDLSRFVMYLIKIDSIGNIEWQKYFWDYYGNSYGRVAQISDDGSLVISGNWYGNESDIIILKMNVNANIDNSCNFIFESNLPYHEVFAVASEAAAAFRRHEPRLSNDFISASTTSLAVNEYCKCGMVFGDVVPSFGCDAGGEKVLITGNYFVEPMNVYFNGYKAPYARVIDEAKIETATPGHGANFADVTIYKNCTQDIQIHITKEDEYEYLGKPIINDLNPKSAFNEQSQWIEIAGFGFSPHSAVYFEAEVDGTVYKEYSPEVTYISANLLKVQTPQYFPVSVANVCVENGTCGTRCKIEALGFYGLNENMPFVPHVGTAAGETKVKIYGDPAIIASVYSIYFDGVPVLNFEKQDGLLIAESPAHLEGDAKIKLCGTAINAEIPCPILPGIYEYSTFGFVTGKEEYIEVIDTTRDKLVDFEFYNPGKQHKIMLADRPTSSAFSKNTTIPGRYAYIPMTTSVGLALIKLHTGTFAIKGYYSSPYPLLAPTDIAVAEFGFSTDSKTIMRHLVLGANHVSIAGYIGGVIILDADTMQELQAIPIPSLSSGQVLNISTVNDKAFLSSLQGLGGGKSQFLITLQYDKVDYKWKIWCELNGVQLPEVNNPITNVGVDSFYDAQAGVERVCLVAPEYIFNEAPAIESGALFCADPCQPFDQKIALDELDVEAFPQDVAIGKIIVNPLTGETDWKAFVADSATNKWTRINGLLTAQPWIEPPESTSGITPLACEIRSNYDKVYFVNNNSADFPIEQSDITAVYAFENQVKTVIIGISQGFEPRSISIQTVLQAKSFVEAAKITIETMLDADFINENKRGILLNKLEVIEQLMNSPANEQAVIANTEAFKNQVENFVVNDAKEKELISFSDALIIAIQQ